MDDARPQDRARAREALAAIARDVTRALYGAEVDDAAILKTIEQTAREGLGIGQRLTRVQTEKLAAILAKVAELDVTTEYVCPFDCGRQGTPAGFFTVEADHAPDCPITYARELQAFGREITG